jgi:hypothetical protein
VRTREERDEQTLRIASGLFAGAAAVAVLFLLLVVVAAAVG